MRPKNYKKRHHRKGGDLHPWFEDGYDKRSIEIIDYDDWGWEGPPTQFSKRGSNKPRKRIRLP